MKRFASLAILAFLILLPARAYAMEFTASDFIGLKDALIAIKSSPDINSTIWISDTIVLNSPYTIKGNGKNITLKRAAGFLGDMIKVETNAKLTLEDVTLDGNAQKVKSARGAIINNAGAVNARGGVILRNNARVNSTLGAANGGAVTNTGGFTMKGGEISNNSAQTGGGGIFNFGGTASLSGDVKIFGNNARLGGGVCNADNGRLTLSGNAVISGNTAYQGGGVINAGEKARLTLAGNTIITNNTAEYGAGLMNTSELRLSARVQIGVDEKDNGLYLGLYQSAASSNKAGISSAVLLEGARINLEGGINHEGDGLIMVVGRSQRNSMKYFHCDKPEYELTITKNGSLVLKQRAVSIVNGEGYEKKFLIEARMKDFTGAVLNYNLTNGVHYTLSEKDGILTVTLKNEYLKNLGDVRLFIRFEFVDGKAECIFQNGEAQ